MFDSEGWRMIGNMVAKGLSKSEVSGQRTIGRDQEHQRISEKEVYPEQSQQCMSGTIDH
ncbi:MAG: hypothetical protein M1476_02600 [Candidatus Thermoplasmatota archaeon]|nr:hypothetical protein [Candidatus Thermoplasmatota archaeon]